MIGRRPAIRGACWPDRPRWLRCLPLLAAAALAGGCASVAPWLPAPQVEATAPAAPPRPPARPEFTLEVEAPAPLRALLLQHLDLARLQQLPDDERLGNAEFNRLVAAAPAQARDLLQTEGYFNAQVRVQREREAIPEGRRTAVPGLVRVQVQPGTPARVTALQLRTGGALQQRAESGDADALALRQALPAAATLQPGAVFRNADWAASKQQLLTRLRAAGYAAATLSDSSATVDAEAHSASLALQIDSGPLFLAGPVVVSGLVQHDADMVLAQAGFGPGAALTEERLLAFQDRLQKTRLFTSATVTFDPEVASAGATPVRVRVSETLLQQATVGVGISANTGPRVTVEHTHRRPFDWPVLATNKLEWGRDSQSFSGDWSTHPGEGFYRNLVGVLVERVRSNTDVVLSQRLRLGRSQDTPRIERLYFAELLRSRQADRPAAARQGSAPETATAISANAHWVWRDLDSVLLPTRGYSMALQTGAGQSMQRNGPDGPFGRVYGRLTGYWPLGTRWYGTARIEAGQLIHAQRVHVPDALGFRAGGDDSVRGYGFRELAPRDTDGSTISGARLLTASVELARPILPSMPSLWGAVFIDAGRAVNDWRDYTPAWGYGAGLRWRSPIGPLRLDVAWADELKKLRLHFSVGIAF